MEQLWWHLCDDVHVCLVSLWLQGGTGACGTVVRQLPGVESGMNGLCTSGMRLHEACMQGNVRLLLG